MESRWFYTNKEVERAIPEWLRMQEQHLYHDGIFKFMVG